MPSIRIALNPDVAAATDDIITGGQIACMVICEDTLGVPMSNFITVRTEMEALKKRYQLIPMNPMELADFRAAYKLTRSLWYSLQHAIPEDFKTLVQSP